MYFNSWYCDKFFWVGVVGVVFLGGGVGRDLGED